MFCFSQLFFLFNIYTIFCVPHDCFPPTLKLCRYGIVWFKRMKTTKATITVNSCGLAVFAEFK